MRSSVIAADGGFGASDEGAGKSRRRSAKKEERAPLWRRVLRSVGGLRLMLALGFCGVVAIGVPVNALWMQDGPHPAPLFHFNKERAETKPVTVAAREIPLPRPRPASLGAASPEPASPAAVKAETTKPATKAFDAIAQLLSGGTAPRTEAAEKDKTVVFAQRALAKLGYSLHQDGVFGGTTRQAIEKFERANGMPVTGELSRKILHKLSAKSGLALR